MDNASSCSSYHHGIGNINDGTSSCGTAYILTTMNNIQTILQNNCSHRMMICTCDYGVLS